MNQKDKGDNRKEAERSHSLEKAGKVLKGNASPLYSEVIAKQIIDQLLSNVQIEKQRKDFAKRIVKYLIDYSINHCQCLLQCNYIAYDQDDYPYSHHHQLREEAPMFFDFKKERDNTWEELKEPCRRNIEREASSLVKIVKHNQESKDHKAIIKQKRTEEAESQFALDLKPIMSGFPIDVQLIPTPTVSSSLTTMAKRSKLLLSFELLEQLGYKEREEDAKLRSNYQMEIDKQNDLMGKMIAEEKKKKQKRSSNLVAKHPKREFNGSLLTFDSNGKVIEINRKNPDHFPNEFVASRQQIKDIKKIENTLFRRTIRNYLLSKQTRDEPQTIEYNSFYDNKEEYSARSKKESKTRPPYIPCGSAFDLIQPETGVKVLEDERIKEGSNNYSKQYKKTSFDEYTKMLNHSMLLNSSTTRHLKLMSRNQLKETNDGIETTQQQNPMQQQTYVGYKENIQSLHNPLVQNAEQRSDSVERTINKETTGWPSQVLLNTKLNPLIMRIKNSLVSIHHGRMKGSSDSIKKVFALPMNHRNEYCHYRNDIIKPSHNDSSRTLLHNNSALNVFKTRNTTDLRLFYPFPSTKSFSEVNVIDMFNRNIIQSKKKNWGNDVMIRRPKINFQAISKNQCKNDWLVNHFTQLHKQRKRRSSCHTKILSQIQEKEKDNKH